MYNKKNLASPKTEQKKGVDLLKQLLQIIDEYDTDSLERCYNELMMFEKIVDCVCGKLGNSFPAPNGKYYRGYHQRRIPTVTIENVIPILEEKFKESPQFADFEALFDYVDKVKVHGFGPLIKYDFCVHYGFKYGLKPEQFVYLHAGTYEGAVALKKAGLLKSVQDRMDVSEFPEPLRELGAMHIENFLCTKKEQLKQLKP